ncbi:unnamed protein product, partial [Nesidiocoris tenuis]
MFYKNSENHQVKSSQSLKPACTKNAIEIRRNNVTENSNCDKIIYPRFSISRTSTRSRNPADR